MLKRDNQFVLSTEIEAPGFRVELRGTTFRLVATGAWTISEVAVLDEELKRLKVPIPPSSEFTGEMDISGIAEIDTSGAWLLQRTASAWQRGGLKTRYAGATDSSVSSSRKFIAARNRICRRSTRSRRSSSSSTR